MTTLNAVSFSAQDQLTQDGVQVKTRACKPGVASSIPIFDKNRSCRETISEGLYTRLCDHTHQGESTTRRRPTEVKKKKKKKKKTLFRHDLLLWWPAHFFFLLMSACFQFFPPRFKSQTKHVGPRLLARFFCFLFFRPWLEKMYLNHVDSEAAGCLKVIV